MSYSSTFWKIENDIFVLQLSCFVFDCLKGHAPNQFMPWFTLNSQIHDHATRSNTVNISDNQVIYSNNLFVPYARTTYYGLKSIKVSRAKTWNYLPASLRDINSSRNSFKKNLHKHLMSFYNQLNWSKVTPFSFFSSFFGFGFWFYYLLAIVFTCLLNIYLVSCLCIFTYCIEYCHL